MGLLKFGHILLLPITIAISIVVTWELRSSWTITKDCLKGLPQSGRITVLKSLYYHKPYFSHPRCVSFSKILQNQVGIIKGNWNWIFFWNILLKRKTFKNRTERCLLKSLEYLFLKVVAIFNFYSTWKWKNKLAYCHNYFSGIIYHYEDTSPFIKEMKFLMITNSRHVDKKHWV